MELKKIFLNHSTKNINQSTLTFLFYVRNMFVIILLLMNFNYVVADCEKVSVKENNEKISITETIEDQELNFEKISIGDSINLNNILLSPRFGEKQAKAIVEFEKKDLTDSFIESMFSINPNNFNRNIKNLHPFNIEGLKLDLKKNKMIMTISSGPIVHFKNNIRLFPNFRTFKNENVVGKVIQIDGDFYVSKDVDLIRNNLKDYSGGRRIKINASKFTKTQN